MKIRVSLWLTIFLFLIMLLGGAISSYIGYFMGSQALKVVTQPDINSENKNPNQKPLGGEHKGLKIVEEEKILQKVYNEINKKRK